MTAIIEASPDVPMGLALLLLFDFGARPTTADQELAQQYERGDNRSGCKGQQTSNPINEIIRKNAQQQRTGQAVRPRRR